MGTPLMTTLRWLRVPGDTLFAIGAIAFVLFIFGLKFGYSLKTRTESASETLETRAA
jgi:nitric oxide reductase subunit B